MVRARKSDAGARSRAQLSEPGFLALSVREQQVLSLTAQGLLDRQISAILGISLNTLRTYWQRIRAKVGEASRSALAVAYVRRVADAARRSEVPDFEPDWEVDFATNRSTKLSNREAWLNRPIGSQISMEDIYAKYHPEDQARLRSMWVALKLGELEACQYQARTVSEQGVKIISAFIKVVRDELGRPVKAQGRNVPVLDLRAPHLQRLEVGYFTYQVLPHRFTIDDKLRSIFRIKPDEAQPLEAFSSRFEPEELDGIHRTIRSAIARRETRMRRTSPLAFGNESTIWIALDLRLRYKGRQLFSIEGTVMSLQ